MKNLIIKEYLGNRVEFKMVDGHIYMLMQQVCVKRLRKKQMIG